MLAFSKLSCCFNCTADIGTVLHSLFTEWAGCLVLMLCLLSSKSGFGLQGALVQCLLALKPDGLFLGSMYGGTTLQVETLYTKYLNSLPLLTESKAVNRTIALIFACLVGAADFIFPHRARERWRSLSKSIPICESEIVSHAIPLPITLVTHLSACC